MAQNFSNASQLFFPFAKQPDIIRASQKDEYYMRILYDQTFDALQYLLGPRRCMAIKDEIKLCSDAFYYGLSTVIGRQTLGEEYCDIVQVSGKEKIPVKLSLRILLMLYELGLPYASQKLYLQLLKLSHPGVQTLRSTTYISESTRKNIAKYLPYVKDFIGILQRVHIGIFYFAGKYYHLSKRLVNVIYILNRSIDGRRLDYSVLGFLIFVQFFISFVVWISRYLMSMRQRQQVKDTSRIDASCSSWVESTGKCSLCLETRTNTTATSCGHLYCWNCIAEWCNSKPECPLCRAPQKKNELVPIYNFT